VREVHHDFGFGGLEVKKVGEEGLESGTGEEEGCVEGVGEEGRRVGG